MKTSGPEYARQRDTLGRPIWNDPQTPQIARRRAEAMSAAWREGEPVDVWQAFRRLHFETDWEQLTGEQADEPVLRALETGDVWQPKLIQPGGTALWKGPAGRGARKASALLDAARRRARQAAARVAGSGGGRPALAARAPGRRGRRDHRPADPRDRQAPVPGPDPRLPDLDLLGARAQPGRPSSNGWRRSTRCSPAPRRPSEDVKRLPYVHRVLLETMRLYPPAFGIFREALQDLDIDGHLVPAGRLPRHEPVGDAPRPAPVGRPAALRPGSLGRRREASRTGSPTSRSRAARTPATARSRRCSRPRSWRPPSASAGACGRERQGAGDGARHRPAAEEAAPAHPGRAGLAPERPRRPARDAMWRAAARTDHVSDLVSVLDVEPALAELIPPEQRSAGAPGDRRGHDHLRGRQLAAADQLRRGAAAATGCW